MFTSCSRFSCNKRLHFVPDLVVRKGYFLQLRLYNVKTNYCHTEVDSALQNAKLSAGATMVPPRALIPGVGET
jgi:hypothetical protein